MSNKIFGTDIVDQSASVEVKKLQTDLVSLLNTFIQTSGAVDLMRKALQNVTGYNNLPDALNNNTEALDEMTRVKNRVIALQRQIDVMNSSEYKQLIELREVRNKNNRELREEAKSVVYASDAYKKLEQEYSKAAREAKNLGAELGTNSKQFVDAAQKANLLNDKLKAIDAGMGVHTRNVGNYASATHSLSQVLREMPAFTYSAQTGILALSNNLPILADQFKVVRAETGSTGAALKVFGSSLLSFGNIFTIAIGLVTIFWDKIVGLATGTTQASEAVKKLSESVGQETGKFESLVRQINNYNLSNQERIRAAHELKELYPTALKNYSEEEIAAGKAAAAIMLIRDALVAVAMAKAYQAELDKKAAERTQPGRQPVPIIGTFVFGFSNRWNFRTDQQGGGGNQESPSSRLGWRLRDHDRRDQRQHRCQRIGENMHIGGTQIVVMMMGVMRMIVVVLIVAVTSSSAAAVCSRPAACCSVRRARS